jgi:hypothetical protein
MTVGSRAEVFHGNATQTSGGLTKKDLKMKDGRIISKAASKASKKSYKKTAFKAFVDVAKAKSKDGKFHRVPKEGTKAYEKLLKQ